MPINPNILSLSDKEIADFVRKRRTLRLLEKQPKVVQQELKSLHKAGNLPDYMIQYIETK